MERQALSLSPSATTGKDSEEGTRDRRTTNAPLPVPLQPGFFSRGNMDILNDSEKALVSLILDLGQGHVFDGWERVGVNDEKKHGMLQQIERLEKSYPGGIRCYQDNARRLLEAAEAGANPFDGWRPEIPAGVDLVPNSWTWGRLESSGLCELCKTGFVLVAGGLGERLGYGDIKIGLPVESCSKTTYLEHYCKNIKAMQDRYCKNGEQLPLTIMVSGDTIHGTQEAVQKVSSWFPNISIMCQEKVAALLDNSGTLAMSSPYELDTKPHGHGDVHQLMHSTGTAKKWFVAGLRWVVFFQDTNALAFHALPAMLGVSQSRELQVNSLAVPRVAKQAVGAIAKLEHADGRTMTVNVEYNQLDPLLRATTSPDGDVNDATTGLSPFPGNINQLVFALEPYCQTLQETQGVLAEFVNPKYADSSKDKFKKPTRLECMMQDYPKALPSSANVGFSTAPAWICYSPCKNNAKDAAASAAQGVPAASAWTAESDQYFSKAEMLRQIGVNVAKGCDRTFLGITANAGPRIVIGPDTAIFFSDLVQVFPSPSSVSLSDRSSLLLSGDVVVESLSLDGRLRVSAAPGTKIIIRAGVSATRQIINAGDRLVEIASGVAETLGGASQHYSEVDLMRGYTLVVDEEEVVTSAALSSAPSNAEVVPEGDPTPEICCTWTESGGDASKQTRVLVFTGKELLPIDKTTQIFCEGFGC